MDPNENLPRTMSKSEKVDKPETRAASSLEDKMVEQADGERACCSTQSETPVDEKKYAVSEKEAIDNEKPDSSSPKENLQVDDEKPCCSTWQQDTLTDNEKPGCSSPKENLCTRSSMFKMMIDGGDDDESDDEIPKELDQAALSRLCVIQGELILRQEARAISELTIKTVLEEERRELQVKRITSSLINSAYSAAIITPVKRKKRNFFRRLLGCCFMCCGRRGRNE